MRFLKCFWIPWHQTCLVAICALFVVLPISIIGILIKSISFLLFIFFMVGILCGGFSIYRERLLLLKQQRQAILREREIRVEVCLESSKKCRLKAVNVDSLIIFDQEYSTLKGAIHEVEKWKKHHPCLKYSVDQSIQDQWFS